MDRDTFFGWLQRNMTKDTYILTADLAAWKLEEIRKQYPNQILNMGVAEQNMINVAAGLALAGKDVYCFAIAAFYQRCLEQIKVNICDMNLPVTLVSLGAGRHYWWDGETHCIDYDRELVRLLPNIMVCEEFPFPAEVPLYVRLEAVDEKVVDRL